ncbi:MAG: type II secretion system protein GspK [Gammaproteobacteria bacterium]|nr:type II secretion system protein GspK [Gammaproteobacteria bacterium]
MRRQRGSVIIIVLWTSILLTVLVTVMAGKVQLSARTAFHNREAVNALAAITEAMNKAEMELLLERMEMPVNQAPTVDADGNFRSPDYRFNGQPLTLHYPAGENMVVRIYNHAGKINLNRMRRQDLQQLIEKRLGDNPDPQRVQDLLSAWTDWTDLNDLAGINGAERDYYESLDPPYIPRNNPEMDTVEELRLIRGFDELFKDVNLDAAFTIYGEGRTVNLNLATREAMQLLPGLTDELIDEIIRYRQERDFSNITSVGEVVPVENFVELRPWVGNNLSSFYSVFAYPKAEVDAEARSVAGGSMQEADPVTQAYMEIMDVRSYADRARVLKVDPYGRLPDTSSPRAND